MGTDPGFYHDPDDRFGLPGLRENDKATGRRRSAHWSHNLPGFS